jgi:hypothetical protein
VVEEAREEEEEIKRGPKGGKKHKPGRGHDRKSGRRQKERYRRRMRNRKSERDEEARRHWEKFDQLSDEQRKLLGSKGVPKLPRPKDED